MVFLTFRSETATALVSNTRLMIPKYFLSVFNSYIKVPKILFLFSRKFSSNLSVRLPSLPHDNPHERKSFAWDLDSSIPLHHNAMCSNNRTDRGWW